MKFRDYLEVSHAYYNKNVDIKAQLPIAKSELKKLNVDSTEMATLEVIVKDGTLHIIQIQNSKGQVFASIDVRAGLRLTKNFMKKETK